MKQETADIVIESGPAEGEALVLTAPISFWGGVDPKTGAIIDVRHPQCGKNIAGKVLFVPATIGSSTASTILLELVYAGKAPAAIVLDQPDAILLLGLLAARELDLAIPPALRLGKETYAEFSDEYVRIGAGGELTAGR